MAVAIREMGFTNVAIYNGGLKDWQRSGLPVENRSPLPEVTPSYISAKDLWQQLSAAGVRGCRDDSGNPIVTLLDYRTEAVLTPASVKAFIPSACPVLRFLLDDLTDPEKRRQIPSQGLVVAISETGNRDWALIGYMAEFGHSNLVGLEYGMRGWIKADLPVAATPPETESD